MNLEEEGIVGRTAFRGGRGALGLDPFEEGVPVIIGRERPAVVAHASDGPPESSPSEQPRGPEPLVNTALTSARVVVNLPSLPALFEPSGSSSYPHSGPMVEHSVADFLVRMERARRRQSKAEVEIVLSRSQPTPQEEEAARAQFHRFFANEAEMADLDLRVNRAESIGALRYSVPFLLLAGVAAGILSTTSVVEGGGANILTLVYLFFLVILWVLLWDPIEMLLFDSYILRLKRRAQRKLASAGVRFVYRPLAPQAAAADSGRAR